MENDGTTPAEDDFKSLSHNDKILIKSAIAQLVATGNSKGLDKVAEAAVAAFRIVEKS